MQETMTQELGEEILRFHRLYSEKVARRFRVFHIESLSQTEYLLLAIIIENKRIPMTDLCERAMMRKQQVTPNINQLEEKGMVRRIRSAVNRRIVWLEPTEDAFRIAAQVRDAAIKELSHIFGQLQSEAVEEALHAIISINRILERFPVGTPGGGEV